MLAVSLPATEVHGVALRVVAKLQAPTISPGTKTQIFPEGFKKPLNQLSELVCSKHQHDKGALHWINWYFILNWCLKREIIILLMICSVIRQGLGFKVWAWLTKVKTNQWKLSHSLSLLIVSRYSTVVVLVVEVVVVVLEVVSASSQQRPVSQSVRLLLFNISHFLTDYTTDRRCLTVPLWAAEVRFVLIMRLLDTKNRDENVQEEKLAIFIFTRKKKIHIHTTRPLWSRYQDR